MNHYAHDCTLLLWRSLSTRARTFLPRAMVGPFTAQHEPPEEIRLGGAAPNEIRP
jgi:hypothetical protein